MKAVTYGYLAFVIGIVVEVLLVTRDPTATLIIVGRGALGSLTGFLPAKGERKYNFESRLNFWPIWLVICILVSGIILLRKKLLSPMYEHSILVLALSYVYWLFERFGAWGVGYPWLIPFLLPALPVFISALTYFELSFRSRLFLSILGSAITMLFGAEFIFRVIEMQSIELLIFEDQWEFAVEVLLQHFFLGTTSMYLIYQLFLFAHLVPLPKRFFNEDYFKDLREMTNEHVDRFSPEQMPPWLASVTILVVGGLFWANYPERHIPAAMAIAIALTLVPVILWGLYRPVSHSDDLLIGPSL